MGFTGSLTSCSCKLGSSFSELLDAVNIRANINVFQIIQRIYTHENTCRQPIIILALHTYTHTHIMCTPSTVFPKPGIVNVTVLLARNEDSCFPQFQLKVQSPIEALASSLPTKRGSSQVAMLAAAVAYLANCDDKDREATMNADQVISEIFKDIQPADLPEWILAWLLCGE